VARTEFVHKRLLGTWDRASQTGGPPQGLAQQPWYTERSTDAGRAKIQSNSTSPLTSQVATLNSHESLTLHQAGVTSWNVAPLH
jgi:hypothetical protein